jgi:hypothetical protein
VPWSKPKSIDTLLEERQVSKTATETTAYKTTEQMVKYLKH